MSFTVKSDYSRANAELIAQAASLGYITTSRGDGTFDNCWRITERGLRYIGERK